VILTVDFGTSVTKVALWSASGLVARSGMAVHTFHPAPGHAEQDPETWWTSMADACAQVQRQAPRAFRSIEAIGCTGARQTFALLDAKGAALGRGLLWSDRRAVAEAELLARRAGATRGVDPRTGVPLDAGSVAAKVAWLAANERGRLDAGAWLLAPRDLIVWRLTGEVATDPTMASRTGLYADDGSLVEELAVGVGTKLPPVVPSDQVCGRVSAPAAASLGLRSGTPVVIGAGDRPCEVLGSGASEARPMVSWGTTANTSAPLRMRPDEVPEGLALSRAADGGWLLEGGLSAAGSFVAWLGRLTGRAPSELAELAAKSPPGARGVTAAPWMDGARAPWWRPHAGAAFCGLGAAHGLDDLARAAYESVAWEVRRCLRAMAARRPPGPEPSEVVLCGAGSSLPVWVDVLTGVTGLPAVRRGSGQAASAGAALLAARAIGVELDLERIDPVDATVEPKRPAVERYAELAGSAEAVASALVGLGE
jgi:xylulokinase